MGHSLELGSSVISKDQYSSMCFSLIKRLCQETDINLTRVFLLLPLLLPPTFVVSSQTSSKVGVYIRIVRLLLEDDETVSA